MSAMQETVTNQTEVYGRILLVVPDHWTRVVLRAELLERGYDAVGTPNLTAALAVSPVDERGPVRLILLEHGAIAGSDRSEVERLASQHQDPPLVLLAPAFADPPAALFRRVVRRPITINDLLEVVRDLVGEPPPRQAPDNPLGDVFHARVGPPWPFILCRRCSTARHFEPVRSERQREKVRAEFRKFALEHAGCLAAYETKSTPSG
jgi:hypothetical protein